MKSRELTYATLVKLRACGAFRHKFHRLFGGKVQITSALAIERHKDFPLGWVVEYLLSMSARAEYEKARNASWAEYTKAVKPTRDKYYKMCAITMADEHYKAAEIAWAEYMNANADAMAECAKAEAAAWAEAYINDKENTNEQS